MIEEGGKVLIPAFAVGRAQEVILILSQAMRKKQIPAFNVFVDGMVRSVNTAYGAFPDDLAPPFRRRVLKGEDPFYSETVVPVSVPGERDQVLSGDPCCIVASSGMLIGGASSYYAEKMAPDGENLIAITGYQDEEAPGRALLDLAQASDSTDRVLIQGFLKGCKPFGNGRKQPHRISKSITEHSGNTNHHIHSGSSKHGEGKDLKINNTS